jgi:type II secretory pathway pseudopilin PulG
MRTFKKIANWIRDNKGVATSLIEATATVAVGAILAGVAVNGAIDAINGSKVQAAINDVSVIGQAVTQFYTDNNFFPLFAEGSKTGPQDNFFGFLVSENGTFPTDSTTATTNWTVVASNTPWDGSSPVVPVGTVPSAAFGTRPDYTAASNGTGADSIEGQLLRDILGNVLTANYARYNSQAGRGWNGPYAATIPKTDPWGDKYIINVRNLHPGYLKTISGSSSRLPKLAVIVLSAGPNRNIETRVDQSFDSFSAAGDDIVFRIK